MTRFLILVASIFCSCCFAADAEKPKAETVELPPREIVYMKDYGWIYYDTCRNEKPEKVSGMENRPDPEAKSEPKPYCPT